MCEHNMLKVLMSSRIAAGDLVFVPAYAAHNFVGDDEISLLVFFGPNYSGRPQ
jgi:hypothetical protein